MLIKDIDSDRWIQFWSFVLKHKHHLHPALNAKGKGNLEAPTFLLLASLLHSFHLVKIGDDEQNKLASLGATLVRNYDPLTDLLTDRGKV